MKTLHLLLTFLAAALVVAFSPESADAAGSTAEYVSAGLGGPLGALGAVGLGLGRVFMDKVDDGTGGGGGGAPQGAAVADPPAGGEPQTDLGKDIDLEAMTPDQKKGMQALFRSLATMAGQVQALTEVKDTGANQDGSVTKDIEALQRKNTELVEQLDKLQTEVRARNSVSGAEGLLTKDDPDQRFDPIRAIQGAWMGWSGKAAKFPERDVCKAYAEQKDLPHDTTAAGQLAVLIPPQFMEEHIERLSANTVALQLGARFIPDLSGAPVEWAKVKGGAVADWIGESEESDDDEVAMGSLRLAPKELAASSPVSKRLLMLTSNRARDLLEEDLNRAMGEKLDLGIMKGGGGESIPLGLVNVPGVGQTDFTASTGDLGGYVDAPGSGQTVTLLLDYMQAKVDARNAMPATGGRLGYAANPLALNKLRQVKDADGHPILIPTQPGNAPVAGSQQGGAQGSGRGMLWGYPVATTTNLAYGAPTDLIFGDWSQIIVGSWGPMLVEMSENYKDYFKRRRVLILMTQLVDTGLRHPEAFEIAANWTNTAISL